MLPGPSDEKCSGLTSIILKLLDKTVNIGESLGDPGKVVGSVGDLGFNVFTVGSGIGEDVAVSLPNTGKLIDLLSIEVLLLLMCLIKLLPLIKGTLFKIVEDLHHGINSVASLVLCL